MKRRGFLASLLALPAAFKAAAEAPAPVAAPAAIVEEVQTAAVAHSPVNWQYSISECISIVDLPMQDRKRMEHYLEEYKSRLKL